MTRPYKRLYLLCTVFALGGYALHAQGLIPLCGINELHVTFAILRLAVGEHPDI